MITIFKDKGSMQNFKNKFANKSVLDFIHEEAQDEQFQFLSVKLSKTLKRSFTATVSM